MGNSFSQPNSNGGGVKNFLRRKFASISCWRSVPLYVEQPSSIHKFKPVRLTKEQEQLLRIYFERKDATVKEVPQARKFHAEDATCYSRTAENDKKECTGWSKETLDDDIADIPTVEKLRDVAVPNVAEERESDEEFYQIVDETLNDVSSDILEEKSPEPVEPRNPNTTIVAQNNAGRKESLKESKVALDDVIADILKETADTKVVKSDDTAHVTQHNAYKKKEYTIANENKARLDEVIADILDESYATKKVHNEVTVRTMQEKDYIGILKDAIIKQEITIKDAARTVNNKPSREVCSGVEKIIENLDDVIADILDESSDELAVKYESSTTPLNKTVGRELRQTFCKGMNTECTDMRGKMSGDAKHVDEIKLKGVNVKENTKGVKEEVSKADSESKKGASVWEQNALRLIKLRNEAQSKSSASEVAQPGSRKDGQKEVEHFSRTMTKTKRSLSTLEFLKKAKSRPYPEKGIRWPSVTDGLSRETLAYYVENFLCSQLFKTRVARKFPGNTTWMYGLSQFQRWVIEHDNTIELNELLRPIKARKRNAKAKVNCWQEVTSKRP